MKKNYKIDVPYYVMEIIEKLNTIPNTTSLVVGGAVRDAIIGKTPSDWDVATNVPMEIIETMFKSHDIGSNKSFGIVVVVVDGYSVEIAQFRDESEMKNRNDIDGLKILV